jgi:hypothetical protein
MHTSICMRIRHQEILIHTYIYKDVTVPLFHSRASNCGASIQ